MLRIELFHVDNHFLLAMLPPGAFLGVGFLIAIKNVIDKKMADRQPKEKAEIERVRIS